MTEINDDGETIEKDRISIGNLTTNERDVPNKVTDQTIIEASDSGSR